MKRVTTACALMAALGACVPQPQPVSLVIPPRSPYAEGRNTIEGRVAVKLPDGEIATCADNTASLIPATPATRARIDGLYGRRRNFVWIDAGHPPARDPEIERLVRHEPCDANGRFRFSSVPDGDYFVVAGVPDPQPASVKREVAARGGVTRHVLLTN